jgi:hypothetical protein
MKEKTGKLIIIKYCCRANSCVKMIYEDLHSSVSDIITCLKKNSPKKNWYNTGDEAV